MKGAPMHQRFWVHFSWIATAATLVVMASFWFARPTYEGLKRYRARQLVADIASYYESGDWMGFETRLLAATRLAPQDESVMLAQARYLSARQHPMALDFWMKVVERYPHNPDVWDGFFLTAIQAKDHRTAGLALEGFRHAAPERLDRVREHEVQLLASLGRIDEAILTARAHLDKGNPGNAFRIAACLLMLEGSEADRDFALTWLWDRSKGFDSTALAALVTLSRLRHLTPEQTQTIAARLDGHPEALLEHGYLATALKSRLRKQEGLDVSAPWHQFLDGLPLEPRIQVARWLVAIEDFEHAELALTAEEAMMRRDAAIVYLDVLGARNQWEVVADFVQDPNAPLQPVVRQAFAARSAKELGENVQFDMRWRRAVLEARGDVQALSFLANYAELQGWNLEAEAVCRQLTDDLNGGIRGWMGLYNLAVKRGDADLLGEAREALNALLLNPETISVQKGTSS